MSKYKRQELINPHRRSNEIFR